MKYPKITSLYYRDEEFKADPDRLRTPEFDLVNRWLITEKIDGMNVRIMMTPEGDVEVHGRTDNTNFHPAVYKVMRDMFPAPLMRDTFEHKGVWPLVILYGEGYGEKIQSGGKYRTGQSFRLFDVRVDEWWLNWDSVTNVAKELGIKTVPPLTMIDLLPRSEEDLAVMFGLGSQEGSFVSYEDKGQTNIQPESIVARTDPLLFNRRGNRVMWKLKFKDF